MSRRTVQSATVGLNPCERIRPERPRSTIQRLVWNPGSPFQPGNIGPPEDDGTNPRMALRRLLRLYQGRQYREAASFLQRLPAATLRAVLPDIPVDLLIDSLPHGLALLEALYARLAEVGLEDAGNVLRTEQLLWRLVQLLAAGQDHVRPRAWCRLLGALNRLDPCARPRLAARRRALERAVEGLGRHGLVPAASRSSCQREPRNVAANLLPLPAALKDELEARLEAYKLALHKIETCGKHAGANKGDQGVQAASHQRQLALRHSEVQQRLIDNQSLLNTLEKAGEPRALEHLLAELKRRVEQDKEALRQWTALRKSCQSSAAKNPPLAARLLQFAKGCTLALQLISDDDSQQVVHFEESVGAGEEEEEEVEVGQAGLLLQEEEEEEEEESSSAGYHTDESCSPTPEPAKSAFAKPGASVVVVGKKPFPAPLRTKTFAAAGNVVVVGVGNGEDLRSEDASTTRNAFAKKFPGSATVGIVQPNFAKGVATSKINGGEASKNFRINAATTTTKTVNGGNASKNFPSSPTTSNAVVQPNFGNSTTSTTSTTTGNVAQRSRDQPNSAINAQRNLQIVSDGDRLPRNFTIVDCTAGAQQSFPTVTGCNDARENFPTVAGCNDAQRKNLVTVLGNDDVEIGAERLAERYAALYAHAHLHTLDALDALQPLKDAPELKAKILYSVVVLSWRLAGVVQTSRKLKALGILNGAGSNGNETESCRELERSINRQLAGTGRQSGCREVTEQVLGQLERTLYDFPCLRGCQEVARYARASAGLAWACLARDTPLVLDVAQCREFRRDVHVRHHASPDPNGLRIKAVLWPGLREGCQGPCLHRAVVMTA